MSDKPSKDIDPMVIDQQFHNNPKLDLLFSSYQEIINLFPGESLLAFARKFVDTTHDPVTSEKNFYLGLNNDKIKLETIDNVNIDYDKLKSDSNINTFAYSEQPDSSAIDEMSEYSLQDVLDVDVQIILYWVEKFRCIHNTVKQEIWSVIPKNDAGDAYDNTNTYFNNFNESFFSIRDEEYIKDRSSMSYNIPMEPRSQYNKNMMGKIDIETYNTSNDMSSKVELLFLKNRLIYSAVVPEFRVGGNSGELWQINRIYQIVDDYIGKTEQMLCNSVTFTFDIDSGSNTSLGFVGQEAYTLFLPPDPLAEIANNVQ